MLMVTYSSYAQSNTSFNVHFDTDKFNLTTDATVSLDSFVTKHNADTKIKLYGHCDIMAGYEYNDALSDKRTTAVKNYLVSKGFTANNIIEEKGFGKRRPLNRNHGEIEMYMNRRVEIIVEDDNNIVAIKSPCGEKPAPTLTEEIEDTALKAGSNIVLKNMNFYGGTHVILPQSFPVLMELATVMKKNPDLEIAVEGHICCNKDSSDGLDLGTRTLNLSENRAKEICSYLWQNGVASHRLKFKGFGHQVPLVPYPEKTEEEKIMNRRVEIKILKK